MAQATTKRRRRYVLSGMEAADERLLLPPQFSLVPNHSGYVTQPSLVVAPSRVARPWLSIVPPLALGRCCTARLLNAVASD
nr:hypothetical protein CFP56_52867 [Quercus suber]